MKSPAFLFAVLTFFSALTPAEALEGVNCSIAKTAIASASKIRGLKIKRSVPCKLQDKAQVERYLRATIQSKVPRARIENEGIFYRLIGIIPFDFDYLNGMIELYTSQLGGYYDPEQDYYAMAQWMPAVMQMPIAVHELTHALQDQHYTLDHFIDQEKGTSDELMSRSALVEGDATAVMLDYSRMLAGQGQIQEDESVSSFLLQNIGGAMLSSSLNQTPSALQAMLIFPYMSGLRFTHVALRRGGYSEVDRIFKQPPRSTEEILHPEKYFARQDGDLRLVDTPPPPEGFFETAEPPVHIDTLGEFFLATFLGTWLPAGQASGAADGWGGDRAAVYKSGDKYAVVWDIEWDSAVEAKQFERNLIEAYRKRFSATETAESSQNVFRDKHAGRVAIENSALRVRLTIQQR